jgi:hypothetical protein
MAGRKLKVFQAQSGFCDAAVAAPSQPAALRSWRVNQNVFASGAHRAGAGADLRGLGGLPRRGADAR